MNDMTREAAAIAELRRTLGKRLAGFRKAAKLTQAQLGAAVHCHRTTLAHLEIGRGRADEDLWARADEACQADGALLAAFQEFEAQRQAHLHQAKMVELAAVHERLETWRTVPLGGDEPFTAHGVSAPGQSLAGLIDVLGPAQTLTTAAEYTRGIIQRYELEGPQRLAPELFSLRQLNQELGKRIEEADRAALTKLSAQQAALLAYMAVNLSRYADADHFALEAGLLATALGDNGMLAWVKGTQSFTAYYRKQYREALVLAEAGVEIAGSDSQRIRLLSNGVARAAGKLGDRRTVERAVSEALDLATRANGPAGMGSCIDLEPYGWARTASNAATAYLAVGDYARVLELTQELRPIVAASQSDWSRSLVSLDEATALTMSARADLEHAAAVGMEALEMSAAKPIASVGSRARELAMSLHQRGWGHASVNFLDAVREWHKPKEIGR
ncbi:hypothetical protein Lesp02_29930 [Lentzea sp. NBRC 105346]|nr:hypothetical protein Lesp02_29930 [Lentzea sp. NBRC 105346]